MNLRANCISHWKMNDNAANKTVVDSSSNGNDGEAQQNTDILHTDGKINGALTFNGSSDYINVPDPVDGSLDFGASTDFSIIVWVKGNTMTAYKGILKKGTPFLASNPGYQINWRGDTNPQRLDVWIRDENDNVCLITSSAFDLDDGNWHQIVLTCDRDGDANLYIDSVPKGPASLSSVGNIDNDDNFRIGCYGDIFALWDGAIDITMMFNKVLSEEEIAFLWNEGNGREYLGTARPLVGGSLASGRKGLV